MPSIPTELHADVIDALRAVITGSSRPIGVDSTGYSVCSIRTVSVERVRDVLAKIEGVPSSVRKA